MPTKVVEQMKSDEAKWLSTRHDSADGDREAAIKKLSKRDRFLFRQHFNRLRESIQDKGYGNCWLRTESVIEQLRKQIFLDDGADIHVGDFIVMPNHVHMLIVPAERKLELCLKRIKGSSARFCNKLLERDGKFWQADTFDHIVRNVEQLEKYRRYIRDNPRNAGVRVPECAYYRAAWM